MELLSTTFHTFTLQIAQQIQRIPNMQFFLILNMKSSLFSALFLVRAPPALFVKSNPKACGTSPQRILEPLRSPRIFET